MQLRWLITGITEWQSVPGSPCHAEKVTHTTRTLQCYVPSCDGGFEWQDVPEVEAITDHTHGESLSTHMAVTGTLRPAGAAAVTDACRALQAKLDAHPHADQFAGGQGRAIDRGRNTGGFTGPRAGSGGGADCVYGAGSAEACDGDGMSRPPPSREKLIALLIEERAKFIAAVRAERVTDEDRDQARREIERDVLTKTTEMKP